LITFSNWIVCWFHVSWIGKTFDPVN
jgi:hypothetical protein